MPDCYWCRTDQGTRSPIELLWTAKNAKQPHLPLLLSQGGTSFSFHHPDPVVFDPLPVSMESELTILISKAMGSMLTILILEARVLSELAILILEAMRSKLKSSQSLPREADLSYPTLSLLTWS